MPSLRISGHLPAPIVNGGEDRLEKVQFSELQKPRDLDIDLVSVIRHTVVHHSSTSISLFAYQISLKSEKLCVDGHTDVRT